MVELSDFLMGYSGPQGEQFKEDLAYACQFFLKMILYNDVSSDWIQEQQKILADTYNPPMEKEDCFVDEKGNHYDKLMDFIPFSELKIDYLRDPFFGLAYTPAEEVLESTLIPSGRNMDEIEEMIDQYIEEYFPILEEFDNHLDKYYYSKI
jgi:hypothetical protein